MNGNNWGRLIVFKDGHRTSRRVHRSQVKRAIEIVRDLQAKGVRAHLAFRTESSEYPPPRTVVPMRAEGKWWCPYCRAWRFFSIPKYKFGRVEMLDADGRMSDEFYRNSAASQQIRVCQWCLISENDWHVRRANGTWGERATTRRRRVRSPRKRRK